MQAQWHGKAITVEMLPLPELPKAKPKYMCRGRSVLLVREGRAEFHCFDAASAQHAVWAVALLNGNTTL